MNAKQTVLEISLSEIANHILEDLKNFPFILESQWHLYMQITRVREMHLLRDKYIDNPITEVIIALHNISL